MDINDLGHGQIPIIVNALSEVDESEGYQPIVNRWGIRIKRKDLEFY